MRQFGAYKQNRAALVGSPLRDGFDLDFNILTAFIRLGRARPAGAGCPPYYPILQTLNLFDGKPGNLRDKCVIKSFGFHFFSVFGFGFLHA